MYSAKSGYSRDKFVTSRLINILCEKKKTTHSVLVNTNHILKSKKACFVIGLR